MYYLPKNMSQLVVYPYSSYGLLILYSMSLSASRKTLTFDTLIFMQYVLV